MNFIVRFVYTYLQGIFDSIHIIPISYNALLVNGCRKYFFKIFFLNIGFISGITYILKYCCNLLSTYYNYCITFTNIFWLYPLFILVYLLNVKYQNEFIKSYFLSKQKPDLLKCDNQQRYIAHKLWYHLTFLTFIIKTTIFAYIPFIGGLSYWFFTALTYSFFCWEYNWDYIYYAQDKRFEVFQKNWLYFLGYGSIFSFLKINLDFLTAFQIISFIYPILSIKCI